VPVDPHQVRAGDDGLLRCTQCGMAYDLEPGTAPEAVRREAAAFVAAVAGTPGSARDSRPEPRTWSVNAYAAHVADVLARLTDRLERILAEPSPELQGFDEDEQVRRGHFDDVPADRSATRVVEGAAAAVALLQRIADDPDADRLWRRTGVHTEQGELAVWQVACDLAHELHHHAADVVAVAHRAEDLRA
jgi:hypothetical protein